LNRFAYAQIFISFRKSQIVAFAFLFRKAILSAFYKKDQFLRFEIKKDKQFGTRTTCRFETK